MHPISKKHPEISGLYTDFYWEAGPPSIAGFFLAVSAICMLILVGPTPLVLPQIISIYFLIRMALKSYRDFLGRRTTQEEWLRKLKLEDPDDWRAFENRIYEGIKGDKS